MSDEQDQMDPVLEEAADWIVRAGEGGLSEEDARELERWRRADPGHDRAYRELEALWSEIAHAATLRIQRPGANDNDEEAANAAPRSRDWPRWPAALAAAAAVLVVLFVLPPRDVDPEHVSTGFGQIGEVTLADGTVATLGPKTRIEIAFRDDRRSLVLRDGEAFLDVAKDRSRPFVIRSGNATVSVLGTSFNVKREPNALRVAVLEGTVRVEADRRGKAPSAGKILNKGEWASVSSTSKDVAHIRMGASGTDFAKFRSLTVGWREGWLVYDNALLSDVVSDINRYYEPGVILADPGIGELRVTASFPAAHSRQFIASISELFPVRARARADGSVLVSRAP